jgi:hypothetical protein
VCFGFVSRFAVSVHRVFVEMEIERVPERVKVLR